MSDTSNTDPVNGQILDAVEKATEFAFGLHDYTAPSDISNRLSAGGAIAYEKAAQAAALAFQDATDYQRNIFAMSAAAQGKALAAAFAATDQQTLLKYGGIFVAAILGSLAATLTSDVAQLGAGATLKQFPRT
jgi:hypothetical protein